MIAATVGYFLAWALFFHRTRYLMQIFPIAAVLTALVISQLEKRGRFWKTLTFSILTLSLLHNLYWQGLTNKFKVSAALGRHTRSHYYQNNNFRPYAVYQWANQNLPPEALVASTTVRTYSLKRPYLVMKPKSQAVINYFELDTKEKFLARLRELGVTHLIATQASVTKESAEEDEEQPLPPTPIGKEISKRPFLQRWVLLLAQPLPMLKLPEQALASLDWGKKVVAYFQSADYTIVKRVEFDQEAEVLRGRDIARRIMKENTKVLYYQDGYAIAELIYY